MFFVPLLHGLVLPFPAIALYLSVHPLSSVSALLAFLCRFICLFLLCLRLCILFLLLPHVLISSDISPSDRLFYIVTYPRVTHVSYATCPASALSNTFRIALALPITPASPSVCQSIGGATRFRCLHIIPYDMIQSFTITHKLPHHPMSYTFSFIDQCSNVTSSSSYPMSNSFVHVDMPLPAITNFISLQVLRPLCLRYRILNTTHLTRD